jgi:hypothetical protein
MTYAKNKQYEKAFAYRGAEAWNNLSTAAMKSLKVSLALKPK